MDGFFLWRVLSSLGMGLTLHLHWCIERFIGLIYIRESAPWVCSAAAAAAVTGSPINSNNLREHQLQVEPIHLSSSI